MGDRSGISILHKLPPKWGDRSGDLRPHLYVPAYNEGSDGEVYSLAVKDGGKIRDLGACIVREDPQGPMQVEIRDREKVIYGRGR